MSYDGAVVFVAGVHYPVDEDDNIDYERPLRWDDGSYRDADEGEPLHNDVHHANELVLEPGGEG